MMMRVGGSDLGILRRILTSKPTLVMDEFPSHFCLQTEALTSKQSAERNYGDVIEGKIIDKL